MHVSQPILADSCLYPKPEEENPPIFKNGEALKNTPSVSVKARFESQLNPLFAPALFTSTGARRLSSFTTRKSHIINFRLITTTTLPPTTIIEHFLKMPKGTNKNEILSSLAHHEGLEAVSKVKCIFAMSKPKPALGQNPAELFNLKDYFIKETFADTINAFAQNSTLDPDFRAQCIRHMTDKKQQPLLAKDLLKQEPSCSKKLQVKLVYVLHPGKFKNETLKRLSQDYTLSLKTRNILIFNFPEGKFRDTLLEQWMDIPSMALNDQVAPAAFITDTNKRIHHFIRISNHPKASLEARYHCAILLDKGAEKSKLLAELNHIPEGKAYLEKAYKLLREYYPMVQDLDDLSIKAKIPAIYPNCTHNTDYLAFRASIPTVSLK